jgi:hypothetical protein
MISSEVQRTLVKSPPELWAEISDPVSLARHLGEFGEIQITRVEPEQRVEWQAGDTSGSVVIKPSGWGTKVKLTVERELAQPVSDAPDDDPLASHDAPEPEPEPVQTETATKTHAAAELEHAVELEKAVETEHAVELAGTYEPELEQATNDHEIEPGFEIAPNADADVEDDSQFEPDAQASVQAEREPQSERRRGFFARLFGRRRAARGGDDALDAADTEPSEEPAATATSTRYNALAVWAAQVEPPAGDALALAPGDAQHDDETDAYADDQANSYDEYERKLDIEPEPAAEPSGGPDADAPASMSAESTAESQPSSVPAPARAGCDGGAADDANADTARDISAEIKAAEEVAAEEVTAVLMGVLDRLGAAHHRPFSRA